MAQEFTTDNFDTEVLKSDIPVLVDFWAVWCGPCKLLGPTIDELSDQSAGKYKVGKVNVDENQELAAKYGIHALPTIVIFKGGTPVQRLEGLRDYDELHALVQAA